MNSVIELDWLSDRLCEVLRWQLANPGRDDGPEVPYAGMRVWGIFLRLHAARGGGGFGPAPISFADIESYQRLHREPVRPFEIEIIRALDSEVLKAASGKSETGKPAAVSNRPMSPALFDAVFGAGR